ncbi:MAG TPA: twin-arginine translocase TatA/TatE family subunit [Verrucomicrobiae bacterium]|nr:twin-arginine translocase TatA/TatE family subunit [Verrucomicrobiae bacterium]
MLSVPHLIVLFIVALIVFGPEKLPELARNLGKVMSEFRRMSNEMRYTFEDHLREIERETGARKVAPAPPVIQPAENTIAFRPSALPESAPPAAPSPDASPETPAAPSSEAAPHADPPPSPETEKNVDAR